MLSQQIQQYLTLEETKHEAIENILINNIGCRASRSDLLCHFGGFEDASLHGDYLGMPRKESDAFSADEEFKGPNPMPSPRHDVFRNALSRKISTEERQAIAQY